MFKKLLIAVLIFQMAMPLGAEEKIIKSLFDNGATKKLEPTPDPAFQIKAPEIEPPKLVAAPEVDPVIEEGIKPIVFELYKQAMTATAVSPKDATRMIKAGNGIGTGVVVNNYSGCSYAVTANHVIRDIGPKDEILFGGVKCAAVAKDRSIDVAVVELSLDLGDGVDICEDEVKVGDKLVSVGGLGDATNTISEMNHTVKYVEETAFFTDGPTIQGRSGAGIYKDGKLIGVYCGNVKPFVDRKDPRPELIGLQYYTKISCAIPMLSPVKYPVTIYSGKTCKFCRQQHEITDTENDKRVVATWSEDPCPDWIIKKLSPGYQLPIITWKDSEGSVWWPTKSGVYTLDEIVDFVKDHKGETLKPDPMQMAMGGRRNQNQQPAGAIEAAQYIDRIYGFFDDYLKDGAVGKIEIFRSGARTFNVYGGKKPELSFETLFGKTGSIELMVEYKPTTPEANKLPVRILKFGFQLNGDDISFQFNDDIKVYGLVKMVDGQLAALKHGNEEQAKGFIGILTLLSIMSYIHTIYVIFHTMADVELGGDIIVSGSRVDDDTIIINFEEGKNPFVKIRTLMNFNLGINQIVINRTMKTIITKFSGTIFAKQYTLHYR